MPRYKYWMCWLSGNRLTLGIPMTQAEIDRITCGLLHTNKCEWVHAGDPIPREELPPQVRFSLEGSK